MSVFAWIGIGVTGLSALIGICAFVAGWQSGDEIWG